MTTPETSNNESSPAMEHTSITKMALFALLLAFSLKLVSQLAVFMFRSWLAFCVFYTVVDLYSKKRYFVKFMKKFPLYTMFYAVNKNKSTVNKNLNSK
jgi:hypothetical protein